MGTLGIATLDTKVDTTGLETGIKKSRQVTETGFKKLGTSVSKVLKGMQKGLVAATATAMTFKKAFDFSREGAAIIQTGESFGLLLEKIGAAPNLLDQLTKASAGTLTQMELMSSTATLLAGAQGELGIGLANATPQLLKIARAAQKLNPSLGDTAFLYQSLARGIKRASPLILDNTGLVIKVGEANERYAAKIGKTVEQLTAQEEKMALLAETLRAGDVLIDQVGGSVDSMTDSWDRLSTKVGDATDKGKAWLAVGLLPYLELMEDGTLNVADAVADVDEKLTHATLTYHHYVAQQTATMVRAKQISDLTRDQIMLRLIEGESIEETAKWLGLKNEAAWEEARNDQWRLDNADALIDDRLRMTEITQSLFSSQQAATEAMKDDRLAMIDWKPIIAATNQELQWMEADLLALADAEKEAAKMGDWLSEALDISGTISDLAKDIRGLEDELVDLNDAQGTYVEIAASTTEEMLEAQVAAENLAIAQQKLADNTDPDKHAQLALNVERARSKFDELNIALTEGTEYWIDNAEKIAATEEELEKLKAKEIALDFYAMADAAEADADELALLAGAMGLYDEAQLAAELNAILIRDRMEELAQKFADGEISIGLAKQQLWNFIDAIEAMPTKKTITIETRYTTSGQLPGGGGIQELQHGAWRISRNQLAFLHAGEMVVPAPAAQQIRQGGTQIDTLNFNSYSSAPAATSRQDFELAMAMVGA